MSEYRNLGKIKLTKEVIYNEIFMNKIFSYNDIIVLDCDHNAFERYVTYTINWKELPKIPEGGMIPYYNIEYIHNEKEKLSSVSIRIGDRLINFASNEGLVADLRTDPKLCKIYHNGEELKCVRKLEVKCEFDKPTKIILEVIPDKVILNNIEEVKFKKRKVVV